ncbi:SHOCT domain-containing protein [Streptomyces sp. NPDC050738]|uniref:SHOCT domain-containing protein n=1 Tax=Streptomyces sp. NPDC050738 TaxID=3154744 RepID=UPI003420EF80
MVDQTAAQVAAQAPPPAAAQPPATDRVSQLTALADLKAQGLLTEAEFTAEKARILNS